MDELPEMAVDPIGSLLQRAVDDPTAAILDAAPVDDEPVTADDRAAIAEGEAAAERGETIPWDRARSELAADADPPAWRSRFPSRARRHWDASGRPDRERLQRAIDMLPEGDVRRLVGQRGALRLRVGDWRVLFSRDDASRTIAN